MRKPLIFVAVIIAIVSVACLVARADNPHITQLAELVDVMLSAPADGQVLTFDGASGKWENKAPMQPAIPDSPQIVSRFAFSGMAADQFLFTPLSEGDYRISASSDCGGCSGIVFALGWTNENGHTGQAISMPINGYIAVIHALPDPVIFSICTGPIGTPCSAYGGTTHITVEKL